MTELSRFWDNIADKYASQPVADEDAYQTKLKVTRTYFTPESEVLEFGCGTGSTAIAHAPFVKHIQAIDFSARMLEIARERARAANVENVTFARDDIGTLDASPASFDAVLGLSVLHLLKNRDAVIAKVYQLLKPGGVFVTSTACLGDTLMMRLIGVIGPLGRAAGLLPELNVMTHAQLLKAYTDAGFEIVHNWRPGKGKAVFVIGRKPG
ncbi:class I SAM-dependent methyltransferase [Pelagibacterium xiamenense]|uniref:class I SAM-dependent methyltransferase n=1 Tax=Pelagibacterium xiamenense TaxID=2901140 RepID=UPI001E642264|nr:class I SAM-dependent methyltransferase [Pelagibacterium xiamenense]MCD7059591.1 class I SAM-dependent methyltransferase [Pelagibacterium xiamenense]